MRLEVLLAHLAPEARTAVAINLQLPADSIERLEQLDQVKAKVVETLPTCQRRSEVVQLLRSYKLPSLVLIAVQSPRTIRRKIWQYLTTWANMQAPLDGNTLKQLGYKPGPQYRQILDELLAATLDQVIQNEADAKAFLAEHYPLTGNA
jgi:tRNA nucleotidyltransferase (CCA-adding enzyme)